MLLSAAAASASMVETQPVLVAYGPGGPHHVLVECATRYEERHAVKVMVLKSSPAILAERLRERGDIYFGGAEYMLHDFNRQHPDILDMTSVEHLHPRKIGLLVRKGNPLNITCLADLRHEEVDLLAVHLEDMAQFHAPRTQVRSYLRHRVYTGQNGADAWLRQPELDAWVTYKSWHVVLESHSEFIEIPGAEALRYTPVALTRHTRNREAARHFIDFLKSEEARRIFEEHGWY